VRPPFNKVIDISDLTTKEQRVGKHEKEKRMKQKNQNYVMVCHFKDLKKITCMVLTSYHKILTDQLLAMLRG
jgi:hypothetical protein